MRPDAHAALGRGLLVGTLALIAGLLVAGLYLIARHPEGLRGAPRAQERTTKR